MSNRKLIRNARAIVTCDGADRVWKDADILIEDGVIKAIGPNLAADGAQIIDASHKFVYPGLINTHHHFFQMFVRNMTGTIIKPRMELNDWIEKTYSIFKLVDSDVVYYSALTALADLIKHGCTCAFDQNYNFNPNTGNTPIDLQMRAAAELGIRFHAGRSTNTLPTAKGGMTPDCMVETVDEYLRDCERVIGLYHDPNPGSMRQIVMSPCMSTSCCRDTFVETVAMARSKGVYMHTHLAEGETGEMLEWYGKRPLDWCEEIGFAGEDVCYTHCWELTNEEFGRMAKAGTSFSHCAVQSTMSGSVVNNLKELINMGLTVSIGCDGGTTNDSSSLLDSLRVSYLMQRRGADEWGDALNPYELLKVICNGGARALGRSDLGSLEVGKQADLFMIETDVLELCGALHDPMSILARCGVTGPVWLTMVGGNVIYQEGHLLGVDECVLAQKGEEVCTRVLREPSGAYLRI